LTPFRSKFIAKGFPVTYLLNLLYIAMLMAASPWLLWRALRTGRYREGWRQKLWGDVTRRPTQLPAIWLHAVSVGEVRVAATLADSLRERWPDHQLIVSTTTSTGYQLARRSFPSDLVSYAPLDFSWAVRRALRRWRPAILILVELELWPNLITIAHRQGLPVAVVNGRLSDTSRRGSTGCCRGQDGGNRVHQV
jgi:3-deoxy-D-manno-octulosonic-acid transferase